MAGRSYVHARRRTKARPSPRKWMALAVSILVVGMAGITADGGTARAGSIAQTNSFLGITIGADFPGALEICEPKTTVRCVRPNGANYFEMRNEPDLGFPYKVIVLAEHGKATELLLTFRRNRLLSMGDLLARRFGAPSSTKTTPVDFSLERGIEVSHDSLWIGSKLVLWLSEVDPEEEGGAMLQVLPKNRFESLLESLDHEAAGAASLL